MYENLTNAITEIPKSADTCILLTKKQIKDIKKDIDKYYIFDKQADYYFDLLEIQNLINENFK